MKKKIPFKIIAVIITLMFALAVFTACGSNFSEGSNDMCVNDAGAVDGEEVGSGADLPTADQKADMASGTDVGAEYEPKIIKNVTVNAETRSFSAAIKDIDAKVSELGGYVENSDIRNTRVAVDGSKASGYAKYVLRIPADRLDDFLAEAGELFNITSTVSNATDVSEAYYDIEARINVLETEKALLEKMLSETTTTENMVTVEKRLYEVIYQIESYKTALKVYDNKVAYSTVTLNISEVADLTPVVEDDSFGSRFKAAVSESIENFADFCEDTLIFLVYAAPMILSIAILICGTGVAVVIAVVVIRRLVRKRKSSAQ